MTNGREICVETSPPPYNSPNKGSNSQPEYDENHLKKDVQESMGFPYDTPEVLTGGGSVINAIFNLIKTIVGAGIFTLPSAIESGGLVFTVIALLVIGYVCNYTARLLVSKGVKNNILDYEHLIHHSMGKWGYWLYLTAAFVYAYGVCAAYTVVAADTTPTVIRSLANYTYDDLISSSSPFALKLFTDRRIVVTLVSVIILYPISSSKYLKNMAITSFLGVTMFAWVALTALIVAWSLYTSSTTASTTNILTTIKLKGVVGVLSKAAFSIVCHHNQFMIYRSIKNPTIKKYNFVANVSIWTSTLLGVSFALLGYIPLAGTVTSGNILNVLPNDNIWVKIANLAFCIDVILTYPLELFVCRDIIEKLIHGHTGRHNIGRRFRHLYTIVLIAGTTAIGVLVCDLNTVVDITGGLAASLVAFVFPTISYVIINARKTEKSLMSRSYIVHYIIAFFGIFVAVASVYMAIADAVSSEVKKCSYLIL